MQIDALRILPERISNTSISPHEVVLPEAEALQAIDIFEERGIHILGWEGWVKALDGSVGHGSAPQGTVSLEELSVSAAAKLCRETIPIDAAKWRDENPASTEKLHFCITVRTQLPK